MDEENKYENVISKYTFEQLCYERCILLKQQKTTHKQLDLIDAEIKRRMEDEHI
jgi:hypothetical protein